VVAVSKVVAVLEVCYQVVLSQWFLQLRTQLQLVQEDLE
jgi:hypothetical protein